MTGNHTPLLEVKGLKKYFHRGKGRFVRAVNGVSFTLNQNEILGVVGESGCGKSTLGRLVLGLIEPTEGQVFFQGEDTLGRKIAPVRHAMQMVFQNPYASFNPKIRISGALTEVCRYYGMNREESRKQIAALFAGIGLSDDLLNRWPQELSGGQLQRLAIARALLANPILLVADEPLSALDVSVQAQLLNLLENLRKTRSLAMLFISHDMTVIEYLCDQVAVMYLGVLVELAPAAELFGHTLLPYTKSLIAAVPRIDGRGGQAREALKGEQPELSGAVTQGCPFAPRCIEAQGRCRKEAPELTEVLDGHFVSCHIASGAKYTLTHTLILR
jgi:oligopeptide/dipeptide ABC transporter ATP-binding protein